MRHELDYRYIADLQDYNDLNKQEWDVALNGIPFKGERYPLDYTFWEEKDWVRVCIDFKWRDCRVQEGWQVGEQIIDPSLLFNQERRRALVLTDDDGYVTSIDYSKIRDI